MEASEQQQQPALDENNPAMASDDVDETPDFLTAEDAVEVQVNDDDVPMDEDDDEPLAAATEDSRMDDQDAQAAVVKTVDMSQVQLKTHSGPVYAVAATAANNNQITVLSGGGDDKGFLHNIPLVADAGTNNTSSSSMPLSYAHTDSVACAAFNTGTASGIPRLAAVGGYDGAICLYNADTGALQATLQGPTDVEWLDFHPTGTVLLAGSAADGTVWMYHAQQHNCMQVFVGHESAVTAGGFAPSGKVAVTASADGTVRVWNPKTGQSKHVFRFSNNNNNEQAPAGLTCLGLRGGSDEKLIMSGGEDGVAHVCHIGTKKVVASLRHYEPPAGAEEEELPSSVEAVAFFPANPVWCATAGVDGVLKVWDLAFDGGQCRATCRVVGGAADDNTAAVGGITRIAWHPTLPLIVASYTAGAVRLWDARNGQLVHTWTTGSNQVINDLNVQWLGNESAVIVTASDDNVVRLFRVESVTALVEQAATATAATATSM